MASAGAKSSRSSRTPREPPRSRFPTPRGSEGSGPPLPFLRCAYADLGWAEPDESRVKLKRPAANYGLRSAQPILPTYEINEIPRPVQNLPEKRRWRARRDELPPRKVHRVRRA